MKLSANFTYEEAVHSESAEKYKIKNEPSEIHLKTIKHTFVYCLEVLRALLNVKYVGRVIKGKTVYAVYIRITGGYRSKELNQLLKKIGYHPAENSQHCTGEAFDIEAVIEFVDGTKMVLDYTKLFEDIRNFVNSGLLSVDQCIQEKQGNSVWVHLSHSASGKTKDRKQFFKLNY